jgi:hypothetical protein
VARCVEEWWGAVIERGESLGVHARRRKAPWPHRGALRGDKGNSESHVGGGESVGVPQRNGGGNRATLARLVSSAHVEEEIGWWAWLLAHTGRPNCGVDWHCSGWARPRSLFPYFKIPNNLNYQLQKYQAVSS